MEITKQYSKLHRELQLEEYSIPFKDLDEIKTKEEFVNYVKYFQINKEYLLKQICQCKYLEYLHEYMKDDIINLLSRDSRRWLDNMNLEYINKYIKIIALDASNNSKITTIEPFENTLKILYACNNNCGIDDNSLKNACNLEELVAGHNPKITTIKPFAKTLKILSAFGNCGIDDTGLKNAINLQQLYLYNNSKITTIKPFAKTLKKLEARGTCSIDNNCLEDAINLESVIIRK